MQDLAKELSPQIYMKLMNANFDSLKFIILSAAVDIQERTQLSYKDVQHIVKTASKLNLRDKIKLVSEVTNWQKISTGCENIDLVLNGGIPINGINEIFGVSGAGKTQICLQLSLMVQLPKYVGGLEKGAVYISTEDAFPSKRLNKLTKLFPLQFPNLNTNINFMDNIYVEHITDFEQLRRFLYIRLPHLLSKANIGLIIIDSMAAVFRSYNEDVNYVNRSANYLIISSKLHEMCDKLGICIICINQVTENLQMGRTEPCLGLTWSNIVTNRFQMSRNEHGPVRNFKIVFCPDLQNANCDFIIRDAGIK